MNKIFHPAATRGSASYGWLEANYSFSFANFFDPDRTGFGLLRVLNDDTVAPAMGFSTHPHKNMEIVTIPQLGGLKHKDSMGNQGIVQSGDIQVMSAGSGIEHSEVNASASSPLQMFQIWVFPDTENVRPRYDQKTIANILQPNTINTVVFPKEEASENDLWIHQQAYFNIGEFDKNENTTYSLHNKAHGVYLMVIDGTVIVDNETLNKRDALGIWDTTTIEMNVSKGAKLLLIEVPMN